MLKGRVGVLKVADWAFMAAGALLERAAFYCIKATGITGCCKCADIIAMDHS